MSDTPARIVVTPTTDEIDIGTCAELATQLQSVEPTAHVVVDMSGVRFCDSSGLSVLLKGSQRQEQGAGSLQLLNVGPAVARLIEITGLEFLLTDRPE
jgi:anti-sigma B factor antagonist